MIVDLDARHDTCCEKYCKQSETVKYLSANQIWGPETTMYLKQIYIYFFLNGNT